MTDFDELVAVGHKAQVRGSGEEVTADHTCGAHGTLQPFVGRTVHGDGQAIRCYEVALRIKPAGSFASHFNYAGKLVVTLSRGLERARADGRAGGLVFPQTIWRDMTIQSSLRRIATRESQEVSSAFRKGAQVKAGRSASSAVRETAPRARNPAHAQRTCLRACRHPHALTLAPMHTRPLAHATQCAQARPRAHTTQCAHTRACVRRHARTQTRTHADTHARSRAHTRFRARTHTQTFTDRRTDMRTCAGARACACRH
jgi:hypothetical protein